MKERLKLAGCGLLMGLADLLPGISGGTVAFILGIWERLIHSISLLGNAFLQKQDRKASFLKAISFLGPLLSGIILAIFLFTTTVDALLNRPFERICLYSAFWGLIAASSLLCLRGVKSWSIPKSALFIIAVIAAIFLTNMRQTSTEPLYDIPLELVSIRQDTKISNIDFEKRIVKDVRESVLLALISKGVLKPADKVFDKSGSQIELSLLAHKARGVFVDPWIVFCGAAAIGAMLLPGISGSYLLVILGMYAEVIGHVADFTTALKRASFEVDSFIFLSQFGLGVFIGASLFSKGITQIFKRFHDVSMLVLGGFVLGSLGAVWPFWSYAWVIDPLKIDKGPKLVTLSPLWIADEVPLAVCLLIAFLAFVLVFFIEFIADRKSGLKTVPQEGK